jgi:GcrA cell cycle regulator
MIWTDERVEILAREWANGESAAHIARTLGGVTRNAVIGKVHRLGLQGRAPCRSGVKRQRARIDGKQARHAVLNRMLQAKGARIGEGPYAGRYAERQRRASERLAARPDPVSAPLNIPLADLTFGMCRAVSNTNDWGRPEYCGHACGETASFCDAHAARFYQPEKPRPVRAPFERRAPATVNF